ncbi:MAG: GerAB/ArcD/ProY family transporter [Bacillota bacterium]
MDHRSWTGRWSLASRLSPVPLHHAGDARATVHKGCALASYFLEVRVSGEGCSIKQQFWQISSLQAAMLVAGAVSLTGHALAVTFFMEAGGRDAWMAGLLAMPMAAVAITSMVTLSRIYHGQPVTEYLPRLLGVGGYLVAALYIVYYLTTVIFTLRMTTDWLVDSVLMQTPSWVLGLTYMLAVLYAAIHGLDAIARINQFTLPLLSGLGILVAAGTGPQKDYGLLLPMLEFGWGPVLAATFLGLGYFGEMCILMMLAGYVVPKDRRRLLRASLVALLFVVTTLTGPLAGSVATLGYRVAEQMPYPTFTHWMMIRLPGRGHRRPPGERLDGLRQGALCR